MKLKKNIRLLGHGRISSVSCSSDCIDVFIADSDGITDKRFLIDASVVSNLGKVSFAEDYFDVGFARIERGLTLKSIDKS